MSSGHETHAGIASPLPHDTDGVPDAARPDLVELADGDEFDLEIAAVQKQARRCDRPDARVRRLDSGADAEAPAGLDRDDPRHEPRRLRGDRALARASSREPIPTGRTTLRRRFRSEKTYAYRVHVPDPGAYWYHPHIREDYGQELGLYGNILVVPAQPDYWPPAHREELLTLDDILVEEGKIAPFGPRDHARGHGPLRQCHARLG